MVRHLGSKELHIQAMLRQELGLLLELLLYSPTEKTYELMIPYGHTCWLADEVEMVRRLRAEAH